jgi:hypothetical protein
MSFSCEKNLAHEHRNLQCPLRAAPGLLLRVSDGWKNSDHRLAAGTAVSELDGDLLVDFPTMAPTTTAAAAAASCSALQYGRMRSGQHHHRQGRPARAVDGREDDRFRPSLAPVRHSQRGQQGPLSSREQTFERLPRRWFLNPTQTYRGLSDGSTAECAIA